MSYQAEISRGNPAAFLFLIDQSGSMLEDLVPGVSKARRLADVLNRTLANIIVRCTKSEGVRNYFDVGVIGYGSNGVGNGFTGALGSQIMNPIAALEQAPLRVEDRVKKIDDGCGGIIEQKSKFPVWFEPRAYGGTPMCEALLKAAEEMAAWCDAHPESYPPTVLHITDGEANDGDPVELAQTMAGLHTDDGELLLFNLHLGASGAEPVLFPASESALPDACAKRLFRMSSRLPPHLQSRACEQNPRGGGARGFMFNADASSLMDFLDIDTRPAQMR